MSFKRKLAYLLHKPTGTARVRIDRKTTISVRTGLGRAWSVVTPS